MPTATPQETQNRVVELYKAGKTYSQITKETGVQGPVISGIVDKSGIPKRKQSAAAPASIPAPPPASAKPASSPVPSSTALGDLQPPAPPAPKPTNLTYRCDACSGIFTLDAGESIETVACPHCGGKP